MPKNRTHDDYFLKLFDNTWVQKNNLGCERMKNHFLLIRNKGLKWYNKNEFKNKKNGCPTFRIKWSEMLSLPLIIHYMTVHTYMVIS